MAMMIICSNYKLGAFNCRVYKWGYHFEGLFYPANEMSYAFGKAKFRCIVCR